MRIAIVGGSFDPIHDGHIQMANQALQSLGVDAYGKYTFKGS